MKDLGPIDITHRARVADKLQQFPPIISEQTFTNCFVWRETRPLRLIETEGILLIVWERGDQSMLLGPPVGSAAIEAIADALTSAELKPLTAIERAPETALALLPLEGWTSAPDTNNADYVYRREELAELAGRRFHKKRNLISQCLTEHDPSYEPITRENLDEVRDMQKRWCAQRNCGKDHALCGEYRAVIQTLEHFEALDLIGGALRVKGRIEAFSIGEGLNADTAVVHFEKAMGDFKGLYQVMNQRFCQEALSGFTFVNREQDLGIPGLRQAKESYFPDHRIMKYVLARTGIDLIPPHEAEQRCQEP